MISHLNTSQETVEFSRREPTSGADAETRESVRSILREIKNRGWDAVCEFSREFDQVTPDRASLNENQLIDAWNRMDESSRQALRTAKKRIRRYQKALATRSSVITDEDGFLGQIVRPYQRVGCYIPGGRFPLPSTVLMTAYVAQVAGVDEIVICSPPGEQGTPHPVIQGVSSLMDNVDMFSVGGVQAIGAMTYGAGSVPAVDIIVGPGNLYVTLAKKEVYGQVDIDMLAGPSEIAVVATQNHTKPEYVSADLLSQAEHDPLSRSYLFTPDQSLLDDVDNMIREQIESLDDVDVITKALESSALVKTTDLSESVDLVESLAPEHLELHVENPSALSRDIQNAGAIFQGIHSPEPVGDYVAGPSHTLPTGGGARYFSPLSIRTFEKTQSLISLGPSGFDSVRGDAKTIAEIETLPAHGRSVGIRDQKNEEGEGKP